MSVKAMETLKAIVESGQVPDERGLPVSAGGGFPPTIIAPPAHIVKSKYQQPSKQYTPSGAFEWEKPMTPKEALAWLLMGAGMVVGVWLGAHIGFAMLVGG